MSMYKSMFEIFNQLLLSSGERYLGLAPEAIAFPIIRLILLISLVIIAHVVVVKLITPTLRKIVTRIRMPIMSYLLKHELFLNIFRLIPIALLGYFSYLIGEDVIEDFIGKITSLTYVICGALLTFSLLNAIYDYLEHRKLTRTAPIKAISQLLKIITVCVSMILIASVLMDKSPTILLSGLTALSAVLLITFRDPIYQLSCGITVASQRLCQVGDWISIANQGVDGEVVSLSMTTATIKQWDNSLISVNVSELLNSMINWQNIYTHGRRIKREFLIDIDSVEFMSEDEISSMEDIDALRPYLDAKKEEQDLPLKGATKALSPSLLNQRRLTNIGMFRAYAEAYLHQHPKINQQNTILVRQLQATDKGIPVQIYCFTNSEYSSWVPHESVNSDIADWLTASAKTFGLRLFQQPSQMAVSDAIRSLSKGIQ